MVFSCSFLLICETSVLVQSDHWLDIKMIRVVVLITKWFVNTHSERKSLLTCSTILIFLFPPLFLAVLAFQTIVSRFLALPPWCSFWNQKLHLYARKWFIHTCISAYLVLTSDLVNVAIRWSSNCPQTPDINKAISSTPLLFTVYFLFDSVT